MSRHDNIWSMTGWVPEPMLGPIWWRNRIIIISLWNDVWAILTVGRCAWNVHRVFVPAWRKVYVMRNILASHCRTAAINWHPCRKGCQPVKPRKKAQLDGSLMARLWRWGPLSILTQWIRKNLWYIWPSALKWPFLWRGWRLFPLFNYYLLSSARLSALQVLRQEVTDIEKELLQIVTLKDSITASSTTEAQTSLSQQVSNLQNHKRALDCSITGMLALLTENDSQRVGRVKGEVSCVQTALKDLAENLCGNSEVLPHTSQLKQQLYTIQVLLKGPIGRCFPPPPE